MCQLIFLTSQNNGKLWAKILANRFQQLLPSLKTLANLSGPKKHLLEDNSEQTFNIIQIAKVIVLTEEKEFYMIEQDYVYEGIS